MFLPHPRVGSLRDREVACSTSDRQGSNFESCVWRTVSSHSSHHPQEVFLAQFSLYVHKGGVKPDSFHFNTKLASSFNDFFISKIAKIRDTLMSAKSDSNIHSEPTPPAAPNPLLTFSQISESNVSKLIRSSPSKSCDLDSCPTDSNRQGQR